MDGGKLEQALDRIEAALDRIEAVASRPAPPPPAHIAPDADTSLADRHERLRSAVDQSLRQLDVLIGQSG